MVWLGDRDRIATTGVSLKSADRVSERVASPATCVDRRRADSPIVQQDVGPTGRAVEHERSEQHRDELVGLERVGPSLQLPSECDPFGNTDDADSD